MKIKRTIIFITCIGLAGVLFGWLLLRSTPASSAAPLAVTATRTATRTPLRTPTRTPTATQQRSPRLTPGAALSALQKQLSFFYGGGGPPFNTMCYETARQFANRQPVIFMGERNFNTGEVCILGLAMDEQVRISISDGKGNKIGSALFEVQERIENEYVGSIATLQQISPSQREYAGDYIEQHGSDFSDYPAPLIGLKIWLPPDRNGTWQVTAQTDYGQVSGKITANRSGNPPALYMPQSNQNPFLWPPASYEVGGVETGSYPLKAGEAIQLQALGLPRNHLLPVALYRAGRLSTAANLPSDAQGRMGINLTIDPTDPPGQYHLVVVLDAETEGARDVGPFLGIYADTCPGSPPSALFIGDIVELHWDNLTPNNLRSQPGLKGKVTGKLDLGQTAEVLDGFVCADKMVWWKVRTSAGQEGWTSEGQGEKIFLTVIQ